MPPDSNNTDQASWAGLGWSLVAGGQISRTVQGKNDEDVFLNEDNDYTVDFFSCDDEHYKYLLATGSTDRQSDIYSYSFPGGSGNFLMRQNGMSPLIYPHRPIRIYHAGDTYEIIDENGIIYRYGKNSNNEIARDYNNYQATGGGSGGYISAWHLMEIIDPNTDDYIRLEYQSIGTMTVQDIDHNLTIIDACSTTNPGALPCPQEYISDITVGSPYTTISQMALKTIYFKNGRIDFIAETLRSDDIQGNAYALDRIELHEKSGVDYEKLRIFEIRNKSYFTLKEDTTNVRLKLDGLKVYDGKGTFINDYRFTYHTDYFSWDIPYNSLKRDLFGFYNGNPEDSNNLTLIPRQEVQFILPNIQTPNYVTIGTERYSDTTYFKKAIIRSIEYPTGGRTEFEFEPHRILENNETVYVPGLRIKRMSSITDTSSVTKVYDYGENESGVGIKNYDLRNFHFISETLFRSSIPTAENADREYRARMYFSNASIGPGYEDAPVIYPFVTEKEMDETGQSSGKTVFEFDNGTHIGDPVFYVPYSNKILRNSMSWARGKLTKKSVYHKDGYLVSETEIGYTPLNLQTQNVSQSGFQYIFGINSRPTFLCEGIYSNDRLAFPIFNFQKTTGIYKENYRKETLYAQGLHQFTTENFVTYDPVNLEPAETWMSSSQSDFFQGKFFTYAHNLIDTTLLYSGPSQALKESVKRNMIGSPVEERSYNQLAQGPKMVTGGKHTGFKVSQGKVVPDSLFLLETEMPIDPVNIPPSSALQDAIVRDGRFTNRLNFDVYSGSGHIRQYSEPGGMVSIFLWNENNAFPVAKVANATAGQIAYTSFEDGQKGGWNYSGQGLPAVESAARTGRYIYRLDSGSLNRNVPDASTSNPYRLTLWARSSGSAAIQWSFMGQTETLDSSWKLVERTVTGTSLSISGQGILVDEVRLGPENALFSTYSHRPLVGIQDEMDAANRGMKYIYDGFGRLESVLNEKGELINHYEYTFKRK